MHVWRQTGSRWQCLQRPQQGREAFMQGATATSCAVWILVPSGDPAALNTGLLWGQLNPCDTKEAASCSCSAVELAIGPRIERVGSFSLLGIPFFIGNVPALSTWRELLGQYSLSPLSLTPVSPSGVKDSIVLWSTSSSLSLCWGMFLEQPKESLLGYTRFSFPLHIFAHSVFMGWTVNNCSNIWGTCWIFKNGLFIFKFAAIIETQ